MGLCFGHQLVASEFGCEVGQREDGLWEGVREFVTVENSLFDFEKGQRFQFDSNSRTSKSKLSLLSLLLWEQVTAAVTECSRHEGLSLLWISGSC